MARRRALDDPCRRQTLRHPAGDFGHLEAGAGDDGVPVGFLQRFVDRRAVEDRLGGDLLEDRYVRHARAVDWAAIALGLPGVFLRLAGR